LQKLQNFTTDEKLQKLQNFINPQIAGFHNRPSHFSLTILTRTCPCQNLQKLQFLAKPPTINFVSKKCTTLCFKKMHHCKIAEFSSLIKIFE